MMHYGVRVSIRYEIKSISIPLVGPDGNSIMTDKELQTELRGLSGRAKHLIFYGILIPMTNQTERQIHFQLEIQVWQRFSNVLDTDMRDQIELHMIERNH